MPMLIFKTKTIMKLKNKSTEKINLDTTFLIQGLNKPYPSRTNDGDITTNPFSFGGGYINGGLTKESMALLSPIFSFHYMGCAEYEFGILPESFGRIIKNIKNYTCFETEINKNIVHVICKKQVKEQIINLINLIAANKIYIKGGCNFNTAIGLNKYCKKENCLTIGWIELDNDFLFFVDKEAFTKTCKLFDLI